MCIVNVQQSCASTTKLATCPSQKCWPAPLRRSHVSSGGAASQRAEPGSAGGARLRFGLLPGIWAPATWPEWLCRICSAERPHHPSKAHLNWPVGTAREVKQIWHRQPLQPLKPGRPPDLFAVWLRPDETDAAPPAETRLRRSGANQNFWVSWLGQGARRKTRYGEANPL
jgi:hypothetical protein